MVSLIDDFETLDIPPWINPGGKISSVGGLLQSTGVGGYLLHTRDSTLLVDLTQGALTTVDFGVAHGYIAGDTWWIQIVGETADPAYNGPFLATFLAANTATIPLNSGALPAPNDDGAVYYNKKTGGLDGAIQDIGFNVVPTVAAELDEDTLPAQPAATLWGRYRVNGATAATQVGYGLQVFTSSTQGQTVIRLVKLNRDNGSIIVLASTQDGNRIRLRIGPDDTGFQVAQMFRLTIEDLARNPGGQVDGVRLRAYVNRDDLGDVALEWIDRGGGQSPTHLNAGTWAIFLETVSLDFIDAFSGSDAFVAPDFGVGVLNFHTKAEMRTLVKNAAGRGAATNLDDTNVDQVIYDSFVEYMEFLGDAALWAIHLEHFTLAVDGDNLVSLPIDIGHVYEVYDTTTDRPVRWHTVDEGFPNTRIAIYDLPSGTDYLVKYRERLSMPVADADPMQVPKEHDEPVRIGALLRLLDSRRDPNYHTAIATRLDRLMRHKMSAMQRQKRMERPHITIDAGGTTPTMLLGGVRQRRGPF